MDSKVKLPEICTFSKVFPGKLFLEITELSLKLPKTKDDQWPSYPCNGNGSPKHIKVS